MHPVLLRFGRFVISSYGLLLALSFMIGIFWSMHRAKKRGIDQNLVMDLALIIVFCAIVGSRLMYVVTHLDEFRGRWLDTFNPFQSSGQIGLAGLTMLGGVVLSLIALVIFCRVKKLSMLRLADILAPAFGLGIFFTRIGCFLTGCCYGKACELPWAVRFPLSSPAGSDPELQGLMLHPTQLYSALYGLGIMGLLVWLDRKPRPDGSLMAAFFMLYGLCRFFIDFVRAYEASVKVVLFGYGITFNQVISFLMFVAGLVIWFVVRKGEADMRKTS
jgi:phosphatidylglycerol:prolipoprotein diacylglycerol transferase